MLRIEILWNESVIDIIPEFKTFVQQMANRLAVGNFRYGKPKSSKLYFEKLKLEAKAYTKTGNAEHLMNIANYAILERLAPSHKKYHHDSTVDSVTRGKIKGLV